MWLSFEFQSKHKHVSSRHTHSQNCSCWKVYHESTDVAFSTLDMWIHYMLALSLQIVNELLMQVNSKIIPRVGKLSNEQTKSLSKQA